MDEFLKDRVVAKASFGEQSDQSYKQGRQRNSCSDPKYDYHKGGVERATTQKRVEREKYEKPQRKRIVTNLEGGFKRFVSVGRGLLSQRWMGLRAYEVLCVEAGVELGSQKLAK